MNPVLRQPQTDFRDLEALNSDESLQLLTNPELRLLQDVTLDQLREAQSEASLVLLGRIWYRLEEERRRRAREVAELEKMYFSR